MNGPLSKKRSMIAALAVALACVAAPAFADTSAPDDVVEMESKWRGLSDHCSYLAPKGDFVRDIGRTRLFPREHLFQELFGIANMLIRLEQFDQFLQCCR